MSRCVRVPYYHRGRYNKVLDIDVKFGHCWAVLYQMSKLKSLSCAGIFGHGFFVLLLSHVSWFFLRLNIIESSCQLCIVHKKHLDFKVAAPFLNLILTMSIRHLVYFLEITVCGTWFCSTQWCGILTNTPFRVYTVCTLELSHNTTQTETISQNLGPKYQIQIKQWTKNHLKTRKQSTASLNVVGELGLI